MIEKSRITLDLVRADDKASWVTDHLITSFSEGIAQSAKEVSRSVPRDFELSMETPSRREKAKREKYETSRPYDEIEKIELIQYALREVFITLPAIQDATARSLREFGASAAIIEFSAPDDEERAERSYAIELYEKPETTKDLERRLTTFQEKLNS